MSESEATSRKSSILPLLLRIVAGILLFFALTLIIGYFFTDLRKDLEKYYIFQLAAIYLFDTTVEQADTTNYFGIAFAECVLAFLCIFLANKLSGDNGNEDNVEAKKNDKN
ncbi:hypothetical protein GINT2_001236 [Glugoides intestinalis]